MPDLLAGRSQRIREFINVSGRAILCPPLTNPAQHVHANGGAGTAKGELKAEPAPRAEPCPRRGPRTGPCWEEKPGEQHERTSLNFNRVVFDACHLPG